MGIFMVSNFTVFSSGLTDTLGIFSNPIEIATALASIYLSLYHHLIRDHFIYLSLYHHLIRDHFIYLSLYHHLIRDHLSNQRYGTVFFLRQEYLFYFRQFTVFEQSELLDFIIFFYELYGKNRFLILFSKNKKKSNL